MPVEKAAGGGRSEGVELSTLISLKKSFSAVRAHGFPLAPPPRPAAQ